MRIFPLSRKLVTAVLTAVFLVVLGIIVNKLTPGQPVPPDVLALVPLAAGSATGWLVREVPDIVASKGGFDNAALESKLKTEAENEQAADSR